MCVINRDGTPSRNSVVDLPLHVCDDIRALGLVDLQEETAAGFWRLLLEDVGHDLLREICMLADAQLLIVGDAEGDSHGRS